MTGRLIKMELDGNISNKKLFKLFRLNDLIKKKQ